MSESEPRSRAAQFLYDHPRVTTVLFTLLLSQAGLAVAGDTGGADGGI